MKNAYVLEHHLGDDGTVSEGMILSDVSDQRFKHLEQRGLVREATAAEVKAGYQPKIPAAEDAEQQDADGSKEKQAPANKKAAEPANKGA
jgi:hypothetical protein